MISYKSEMGSMKSPRKATVIGWALFVKKFNTRPRKYVLLIMSKRLELIKGFDLSLNLLVPDPGIYRLNVDTHFFSVRTPGLLVTHSHAPTGLIGIKIQYKMSKYMLVHQTFPSASTRIMQVLSSGGRMIKRFDGFNMALTLMSTPGFCVIPHYLNQFSELSGHVF